MTVDLFRSFSSARSGGSEGRPFGEANQGPLDTHTTHDMRPLCCMTSSYKKEGADPKADLKASAGQVVNTSKSCIKANFGVSKHMCVCIYIHLHTYMFPTVARAFGDLV